MGERRVLTVSNRDLENRLLQGKDPAFRVSRLDHPGQRRNYQSHRRAENTKSFCAGDKAKHTADFWQKLHSDTIAASKMPWPSYGVI
jgi:hypothetical protein